MKRVIIMGCLFIGIIFMSNSPTFAQDNNLKLGVGLIYGSEIEQLGIRADGYYRIDEMFRVGGSLGYFFPNDYGPGDVTWFEIDINGNYIFFEEEDVAIYGLGGLNIMIINVDPDVGSSDSNSEIGLNLGAGIEYAVNFGILFSELKFGGIGGDADQLVLGGGVRFIL